MEPRIQIEAAALDPIELSVIVPSYNERNNVPVLMERLGEVLNGVAWEAIVVDDDSPDGTAGVVKDLSRSNPRVRCLRRVGRRGLSGACVEGILSSSAPVVVVMDADLQHDETILPKMLDEIRAGADLVVGSRYVEGGTAGDGLSSVRRWGSEFATSLAKKLLKITFNDPMSGFFMIRREKVEAVAGKIAREGFKILLDIVSSSPPMKTVEVPFTFRERLAGESKLDSLVTAEYLGLLVSKFSGGLLPVRFLMFASVGVSGVAVHLATINVAMRLFDMSFEWGQFTAVMVAMTWNFLLNNQLTYRDRRLKGFAFLYGLVTFYIVCSVGTVASVGVGSWVYGHHPVAWIAALAGALLSAVFNYAASSVFTWRK
ncbi:MAG: glycosyltransferase family 2 protein [Ancalomicrobiaceae bacterium]|nr:glycosyltransferase family 2 protein [Ancalomicrobiaceae bacterium]